MLLAQDDSGTVANGLDAVACSTMSAIIIDDHSTSKATSFDSSALVYCGIKLKVHVSPHPSNLIASTAIIPKAASGHCMRLDVHSGSYRL